MFPVPSFDIIVLLISLKFNYASFLNITYIFVYRLASTVCRKVTTLVGLKWELRGEEHLEKDRACIIVANHQSSLDVLGKHLKSKYV